MDKCVYFLLCPLIRTVRFLSCVNRQHFPPLYFPLKHTLMLNCHSYLLNIFYNYKFFVNNCNINLKVWDFYIFTRQSLAILSHNAPMRKHMWKQFDKYKPQLIQVYSSGIHAKMHISRLSLMTWKCNPVMLRKPCLFPIDSWKISEIPKWNISTFWSSLVFKIAKAWCMWLQSL